MSVVIEIPEQPVVKHRARTVGGHTYTPPATRAFESSVAWHTRAQVRSSLTSDVGMEITLCSTRKLTGDIDNYAKAVIDGLVKGGALKDDRQIQELRVRKVPLNPEDVIWVSIWEIGDGD